MQVELRGKNIYSFNEFNALFEGGAAIKSSRRIREDEFPGTLKSIEEKLLSPLGINEGDFIVIGSIGKKSSPSDTSGDLDIGISLKALSSSLKMTAWNLKEAATALHEEVERLVRKSGFSEDFEINHLKGLNIVSLGWPIDGDFSNGVVQLDLIPITDMEWAEFIYYSPDEKKRESKYKSAHRNWLFSAILYARREILETDDNDDTMVYRAPVLVLSSGLYKNTKSFKGKLKPRLKRPSKIEGSEKFITNDPDEFIKFTLGKSYPRERVKTFEDVFNIITSDQFDLKNKLDEIKEKYLEYMERTKLEVPKEIEQL